MCVKDHYSSKGRCERKPEGVKTDEDGTTLANMELERGYYRFSLTTAEVYECSAAAK